MYKFYSGECPEDFVFKEHQAKVKCIQWLDDDTGFVSAGMDGAIFVWKLYLDSFWPLSASDKSSVDRLDKIRQVNPVFRFDYKYGRFSDIAVKTDSKTCIYAVTEDQMIKEIERGKEVLRYEASNVFSSLASMLGSKLFFAGVADPEKPGPIHILRHPWNKVYEVQAHSLPVEKVKLSYDNNSLFSGGRDGVVCLFDVKDT